MKILLFLLGLVAFAMANSDLYEGHQLLRLAPKTLRAQEHLKELVKNVKVMKVLPGADNHVVYDVVVSPDQVTTFKAQMTELNIEITVKTEDLKKSIDEHMELNEKAKEKAKSSKKSPRIDHSFYRTLDETNAVLAAFAADNPTFMAEASIGDSLNGRAMNVIRVSTTGFNTNPIIWIDCNIHAREWVTSSSCLYFLDSLSQYASDASVSSLLDRYDFHILTVANPDGYDYTWTDDRLWRKNRFQSGTCWGVDLNRNWDSHWGEAGAASNPCLDTYDGPGPFSEFETQNLRDHTLSMASRIAMYFSLHSYSELWLWPYGYSRDFAADDAELDRVAAIGVAAINAPYGTSYDYGSIARILYEASGNTIDWTYDVAGIKYSYTLELRDKGRYGFELPPDQIEPTGIETWEGLKAAVNSI